VTDDEIREKVKTLHTPQHHVPPAYFEWMRDKLRNKSAPYPPISMISGFVQSAFMLWPTDMPALVRLPPNERKALMEVVKLGNEDMHLKLRAAQWYRRACWLSNPKESVTRVSRTAAGRPPANEEETS